jgi:curved DNA-binding protein
VLTLPVEDAYHGGQTALSFSDPFTGEPKRLTVKIPPGVREGQRIRLAGQGRPGPTPETAGDLYLRIHLHRSDRFWLEDQDVHTSLDIAPWEAALGATVTLSTLDGPVRLKVPAGSSSGRKIRLKGKGYPLDDGSRSDLFAEVRIVVPETLGDEERRLIEQLSKVSPFRARPHEEGAAS